MILPITLFSNRFAWTLRMLVAGLSPVRGSKEITLDRLVNIRSANGNLVPRKQLKDV